MIIGRQKEQMQLRQMYASEQSEFVVLYGRRRVGKTYLVRETFQNTFAFKHTGIYKAEKEKQLKEFSRSLQLSGMRDVPKIKDWYDAFAALGDFLGSLPEGRKVVFIDELPWMDTPKSGLISALEHFWNGWVTYRNDIVLIVCGSATSWIIKKLIKNYGGLHNRLTKRIVLTPFTLHECELYANARELGMTRQQLLETYMVLGGIPYYWSLLQRQLSWAQSIDALFFAPEAELQDEFEALYASLFRNPMKHIEIVKILGTKKVGMTRGEIADALGEDHGGTLSGILDDLEQCGFIRAYQSIGKSRKDTMYQLIDTYTLFYYKFIQANRQRDEHFWSRSLTTPMYNAWSGLAFERVCMQHVQQIKRALSIAGVGSNAYSWTYRAQEPNEMGVQIDMLLDRDDQVIDLCEMKFSHEQYTISKQYDDVLRHKVATFMEKTGTRKAVRVMIVTTLGLANNQYAGNVHNVVTMDDLFKE